MNYQDQYDLTSISPWLDSENKKGGRYKTITIIHLPTKTKTKTYWYDRVKNHVTWNQIVEYLENDHVVTVTFTPPSGRHINKSFITGQNHNVVNADFLPEIVTIRHK